MVNLRELGKYPKLYQATIMFMADLIEREGNNLKQLIGIEMNGIPISSAVVYELIRRGFNISHGYTRPFEKKIRSLDEWIVLTGAWGAEQYGIKKLVEAVFSEGDICASVDDVCTTFGSKEIARLLIYLEAKRQGVNIECEEAFYVVDRGVNNIQVALDYANKTDPRLMPAALHAHYLFNVNEVLPDMRDMMTLEEYGIISTFQSDPERYGADNEWISQALQLATKASC